MPLKCYTLLPGFEHVISGLVSQYLSTRPWRSARNLFIVYFFHQNKNVKIIENNNAVEAQPVRVKPSSHAGCQSP